MRPKAMMRALRAWYARAARPLPWRQTRDPYRIWVSEIMLQQTRVAAVLPYYQRFLARFPDVRALAAAPPEEVLACWSGLGYYSRARNLQAAARIMAGDGGFPRDYAGIRALPGVGDYTAAAVASIAFDLPYAVLDGNVLRVLARITDDHGEQRSAAMRRRLRAVAEELLDRERPGLSNQALMELGASLCRPREPLCGECPLARHCAARRAGTAASLPIRRPGKAPLRIEQTLLLIRRGRRVLLWQRGAGSARLAGFWELPEAGQLPHAVLGEALATLRHSITHHHYRVTVAAARIRRAPAGFHWMSAEELARLPLSTIAGKALRVTAGKLFSSNREAPRPAL